MRFRILALFILLCLPVFGLAQLFPNLGGQRAGISALTFLKIDVSPRAAAMGGAQIAMDGDPYALRWNPAAITDIDGTSLAASNTFWVAGINHSYFSVARRFGYTGTFGLSATALNTGAMEKRTELQPNGTGEQFYAYNVAVGLSYSKALTDRFSFGLNAKYINETLDNFVAHTGVVDLGFLYHVDWKNLNFAVVVQSFGPDSKLNGDPDFQSFNQRDVELGSYPAPTVFSLGVSMKPIETNNSDLVAAAQLNHPNDNAENIRLGLEYGFKKLFFLRAGYKINVDDQPFPTFGAGIRARLGRHPLQIDYAAEPMEFLGWQQRAGISLILTPRPDRSVPAELETTPDE